jgi:hypothetical protein
MSETDADEQGPPWPDDKPPGECALCGADVGAGEGRIMAYPEQGARFCDEAHLFQYLAETGQLE